jgi:AraC-like DNA-binding protein
MKTPKLRREFLKKIADTDQILQLFMLLPDVSFFIKDREGRFIALNRLACEFCGVATEHEALGKNDWDLFPASRVPDYLADDRAVMETGQPVLNRLEPSPQRLGTPQLIITNKVPLRDNQGAIVGVAGFSRRVSQVRHAASVVRKLAGAVDHLHTHFAEPLDSGQIAKMTGLSVSQFERTFRKALGTSPRQYLLRIRLEHASRQLVESDATVAAIALECGFYDQSHFSKAFTAHMGVNPSQYREEHRQPAPPQEPAASKRSRKERIKPAAP